MGTKEGAFFFDIMLEDTAAFIKSYPPLNNKSSLNFSSKKSKGFIVIGGGETGYFKLQKSLSISKLRNINYFKWR
jgi:hypothetical protein